VHAKGILTKAADLVGGDREKTHGKKRENMENIAALWTGYLDVSVTALDVANMMVLMKIARTKSGSHNPDDYIDAAGYAGCAGEIAQEFEDERIDTGAKTNPSLEERFGLPPKS
jgi:hypothetical protein